MTQITRVPRGLQHFLGSQAFGKNPSELSQIVVPIVGIDQFLSVELEKWYGEGSGVFTTTSTVDVTVPDGEVWVLLGIGAKHGGSGMTAGDSYTLSYGMSALVSSNVPSNVTPIGNPYKFAIGGGGGSEYDLCPLDRIIAGPGTKISWFFREGKVTTGNFIATCHLRYLGLEI